MVQAFVEDVDAIAIYAAGIADSFAWALREDGPSPAVEQWIIDQCEGHAGLMEAFVVAAKAMERFRILRGPTSTWGGDLPPLYDVWDAIADAMLSRPDRDSIPGLVTSAIEEVTRDDRPGGHEG